MALRLRVCLPLGRSFAREELTCRLSRGDIGSNNRRNPVPRTNTELCQITELCQESCHIGNFVETPDHPVGPQYGWDGSLVRTRWWGGPVSINPFDDDIGWFFGLFNDEEQHSLRPTFAGVPAGWRVVREAERAACRDYIEQSWADIPLKSRREKLALGPAFEWAW
jgi:uncharacterized protein YbdZ (MbtH family)